MADTQKRRGPRRRFDDDFKASAACRRVARSHPPDAITPSRRRSSNAYAVRLVLKDGKRISSVARNEPSKVHLSCSNCSLPRAISSSRAALLSRGLYRGFDTGCRTHR